MQNTMRTGAVGTIVRLACSVGVAAACGAFALTVHPVPASATPAYGGLVPTSQPDGTTFNSRLVGNENFHYRITDEGAIVQQDPESGTWYQVVMESQNNLSLGALAQNEKESHALGADDLASDTVKKQLYALGGASYTPAPAFDPQSVVTLDKIRETQSLDNGKLSRSARSTDGTTSLPLVTIMVGFEDEPYNSDYDWSKQFFKGDYSITSFYRESSNGKFTWLPIEETSAYGVDGNTNKSDISNDGVVHVTLSQKYGNVGDSGSDEYWDTLRAAFKEAAKYVDFAAYDKNGNGVLDQTEIGIGIVLAGYDQSAGYTPVGHHSIWPHKWYFQDPYAVTSSSGSVSISSYVLQAETESTRQGEEHQSGIGALGHELGHYLGLPDLYDTSDGTGAWSDYTVGYLSMMDGGSWGRTSSGEYRPTFFDAYCRYMLGYIDPEEISKDGTYTATSQKSDAGFKSYIIRINDDEYYLVENRQYESFDEGMERAFTSGSVRNTAAEGQPSNGYSYTNPTGGLVVWHIDNGIAVNNGLVTPSDPSLSNTVNVKKHRPGIMPAYYEVSSVAAGRPLQNLPFMNANTNKQVGSDPLKVLAYNACALPSERTDTGIRISTAAAGAQSMDFTVDFPNPVNPPTPGWHQDEAGTWTYVIDDGTLATGWQDINGSHYWFDEAGSMATGWKQLDGTWYYLQSWGGTALGWASIDGSWYWFDANGAMATGWKQLDGSWYYLQSWGGAAVGWQQVDGAWYHFDASGVMQTGWLYSDDSWYYLNADGAMVTGWCEIDGSWYYLKDSGAMATGLYVINGVTHRFASSGAWLS